MPFCFLVDLRHFWSLLQSVDFFLYSFLIKRYVPQISQWPAVLFYFLTVFVIFSHTISHPSSRLSQVICTDQVSEVCLYDYLCPFHFISSIFRFRLIRNSLFSSWRWNPIMSVSTSLDVFMMKVQWLVISAVSWWLYLGLQSLLVFSLGLIIF